MPFALHILAEHEEGWIKLAIIVVFVIIWGIKSLANLATGAKNRAPGRPITPPPLPPARSRAVVPPPLPGRPQQRRVPVQGNTRAPLTPQAGPLPSLAALASRTPPKPVKRGGAPKRVVAPIPPAAQPISSILTALASQPPTPPPKREQVRSALSTWINADTLRSQFLLAEAIRPPAALRRD